MMIILLLNLYILNFLKFNDRFFKNIYHYFEKNLNSLFEILKNKNYKIFSIILNIPSPILNNDKYILAIIKFIMNIFILFFDDEESITEDILRPHQVITES